MRKWIVLDGYFGLDGGGPYSDKSSYESNGCMSKIEVRGEANGEGMQRKCKSV